MEGECREDAAPTPVCMLCLCKGGSLKFKGRGSDVTLLE